MISCIAFGIVLLFSSVTPFFFNFNPIFVWRAEIPYKNRAEILLTNLLSMHSVALGMFENGFFYSTWWKISSGGCGLKCEPHPPPAHSYSHSHLLPPHPLPHRLPLSHALPLYYYPHPHSSSIPFPHQRACYFVRHSSWNDGDHYTMHLFLHFQLNIEHFFITQNMMTIYFDNTPFSLKHSSHFWVHSWF